jgi:hypothetical protein
MNSGGGQKEKWGQIFIEAPRDEAIAVFYARFGHNPERVSCTCCGEDYAIDTDGSLAAITAYERRLRSVQRSDGQRREPDVYPTQNGTSYLEPGEEVPEGFKLSDLTRHYDPHGEKQGQTLGDYLAKGDALVIYAIDIAPSERSAEVPKQGYVWQD